MIHHLAMKLKHLLHWALVFAVDFSGWFLRFTGTLTRAQLDSLGGPPSIAEVSDFLGSPAVYQRGHPGGIGRRVNACCLSRNRVEDWQVSL